MTREQKLEAAIRIAMEQIAGMPCGGIGEDSYTLKELDDYAEETGQSMEGDSVFHTSQRIWRILEEGLKP